MNDQAEFVSDEMHYRNTKSIHATRPFVLCCILWMWPMQPTYATQIECRQKWSNVFGKTTTKLNVSVSANEKASAMARWVHRANNHRVLARGEQRLHIEANAPADLPIELTLPEVKDGVIWKTTLSIELTRVGRDKPMATLEKPLWIFSRDPWIWKRSQLDKLNIALLDPVGQTAELLERHNIPHQRVYRLAQIETIEKGTVIVGEGHSLNHRLGAALVSAIQRDVNILILAPVDGAMTVDATDQFPIEKVKLQRNSVIGEFDKRLDSQAWAGTGELRSSRFFVQSALNNLVTTVNVEKAVWPWVSVEFAQGETRRGRMIYCGFRLLDSWDESPAPRYFFAQLLESFLAD